MADKVEISKNTLGCLVGGLVASLMAIAFLLGRQTGSNEAMSRQPSQIGTATVASVNVEDRPGRQTLSVSSAPSQPSPPPAIPASQSVSQPAPQTYAPQPAVTPPPPPQPPQEPVSAEPPKISKPAHTVPVAAAPPAHTSKPTPPPVAAAPQHGAREAVTEYFRQLDALSLGLGTGSDPTQFATELLQQSVNGDLHGFDQLLDTTRKNLKSAQAIQPPEVCKEYHRLVLNQLNQSLGLLGKLKAAMTNMDTNALTALSAQGQGIQKEAETIAKLEKRLRAGQY